MNSTQNKKLEQVKSETLVSASMSAARHTTPGPSNGEANMKEIIPTFEKSIFDSNLADVGAELAELGIDSFIDNPIVESIPIARTIIGFAKTAQNIHERNLILQTFAFIVGFNSGTIDEEKVNSYRDKISANPKIAESELGRILIILDKTVEKEKSEILGRLFRSYIMKDISWDEFCELSEATDRLFFSDVELLKQIENERIDDPDSGNLYRSSRLNAIGLVDIKTADAINTPGSIRIGSFITISEFGKKLVEYGIKMK